MQSKATMISDYLVELPDERREAIEKLYLTIKNNLPDGFEEKMGYGMPGWVVPHSTYPAGYHCKPSDALPFLGFASQKNFIALYHMGIYAMPDLLEWFVNEFPKHSKKKLDMGKSCIRFKKPEDIPFDLIAELSRKVTVVDWIDCYEKNLKR